MNVIEVVLGDFTFNILRDRFLNEQVIEFTEHVPDNLIPLLPFRNLQIINPIEEQLEINSREVNSRER